MRGARDFAHVFTKPEQIGKLFVLPGKHARGVTFKIYVIPEGEFAGVSNLSAIPSNPKAVEVFGVVGGELGWTESYGWKYKGPWEHDFMVVFNERYNAAKARKLTKEKQGTSNAEKKHSSDLAFLAKY